MTEVPLWVLRSTAVRTGVRLPKFKKWEPERPPRTVSIYTPENYCWRCMEELRPGTPRVWNQGNMYCHDCYVIVVKINTEKPHVRLRAMGSTVNTVAFPLKFRSAEGIILGNLAETEYQFWIGQRMPIGNKARCRACREVVVDKEGREEHMKAGEEMASCTSVMILAFKSLRKKGRCVVCKSETKNTRWGVPICGVRCAEDYKFTWDICNIAFEMEIQQARSKLGGKKRNPNLAETKFLPLGGS